MDMDIFYSFGNVRDRHTIFGNNIHNKLYLRC